MKKFLHRFLIFLSIVAVLASMNWVINNYFFDHYGPKLPEDVQTVVCGASITRNALNDRLLPQTVNVSQAGRSVMDFYLVAKRIKRDYPGVERIVADFTIQGFSGYRDYFFAHPKFSAKTFHKIYPLADWSDFTNYPLNYNSYIKMLLRQELSPNTTYWSNFLGSCCFENMQYEIPYVGAYEDRMENDLSDSLLEMGIKQYFYFRGEEFHVSEVDIHYLDSLLYWTMEEDMELVYFAGPAHKSTYDKVPEKFVAAFEQKKQKYRQFDHVTLLDYTFLDLPDSCFANHNHLNGYGAEIVSKMVRDTLGLGQSL